jgi:hypothetical protein
MTHLRSAHAVLQDLLFISDHTAMAHSVQGNSCNNRTHFMGVLTPPIIEQSDAHPALAAWGLALRLDLAKTSLTHHFGFSQLAQPPTSTANRQTHRQLLNSTGAQQLRWPPRSVRSIQSLAKSGLWKKQSGHQKKSENGRRSGRPDGMRDRD